MTANPIQYSTDVGKGLAHLLAVVHSLLSGLEAKIWNEVFLANCHACLPVFTVSLIFRYTPLSGLTELDFHLKELGNFHCVDLGQDAEIGNALLLWHDSPYVERARTTGIPTPSNSL